MPNQCKFTKVYSRVLPHLAHLALAMKRPYLYIQHGFSQSELKWLQYTYCKLSFSNPELGPSSAKTSVIF